MQLNQFASTSNQTEHASTHAFSDTHIPLGDKKLTQRVLGGSLVMGQWG